MNDGLLTPPGDDQHGRRSCISRRLTLDMKPQQDQLAFRGGLHIPDKLSLSLGLVAALELLVSRLESDRPGIRLVPRSFCMKECFDSLHSSISK